MFLKAIIYQLSKYLKLNNKYYLKLQEKLSNFHGNYKIIYNIDYKLIKIRFNNLNIKKRHTLLQKNNKYVI